MIALPLLRAGEHVVGIADMHVSALPGDRLVTYALGSCLGITVHDPVAGVGGLLHVMLPTSAINREKARENPFAFVDTGVPALFRACYAAGARKHRMVVKVAGGAAAADERDDRFRIGQQNITALARLLHRNGVAMHAQDVGGVLLSRTLALVVGCGDVVVRSNGQEVVL